MGDPVTATRHHDLFLAFVRMSDAEFAALMRTNGLQSMYGITFDDAVVDLLEAESKFRSQIR